MSTDDLPRIRDEQLARLPLFPLPELVLFPRLRIPLYVFEPRYRTLVADAVERRLPLAIPRLQPGYESLTRGTPAIAPVAGVGWIVNHDPLPDGRALISVQCVARVRILDEPPTDTPYRVARAEILHTRWPDDGAELMEPIERIRQLALGLTLRESEVAESVESLLTLASRPTVLADLVAASLVEDVDLRQRILEEPRLRMRLAMAGDGLADRMAGAVPDDATAPPP